MNINKMRERIEKERADLNTILTLLPILQDLPGDASITGWPVILYVSSWQDFRQVRHAFGKRLTHDRTRTGDDGSYWFRYQLDGQHHLAINCDLVTEGTTCRREKVGEKVVPLYKIVCE